jgi:CheY-like chemotaxis protein
VPSPFFSKSRETHYIRDGRGAAKVEVMTKVLACAPEATVQEIQGSPLWREEFQKETAASASQAITAAVALKPNLILIDRELPSAEFLLRHLRGKEETRQSSIVVLSRGEQLFEELGLLDAGANAVLRLPPNEEWDGRVAPLLAVPTRKQTRITVALAFVAEAKQEEARGKVLNLSTTGMLVDCTRALRMGAEVRFRLELPGFETSTGEVKGSARVVRLAGPGCYGVNFTGFDEGDGELVRRYVTLG